MSAVALDSSVIVAAVLSWHEAHGRCSEVVVRALDQEVRVPQSALVEAYAVMTRLPAPHRLRPADALEVLTGTFQGQARIGSLGTTSTWGFLEDARDEDVGGGLTYDARILAEARAAGATELMTLNPRHFERLRSDDVRIVDPTSRAE